MNSGFAGSFRAAVCGVVLGLTIGPQVSIADGPGANALAHVPVGELPPAPIYWHLDTYRTRAEADAAKGPRGTVVEAFSRVWLFTLAEADWHPAGGERVARVGPQPQVPSAAEVARNPRARSARLRAARRLAA